MAEASEALNFEQAKEYRDMIRYIEHVTSKQHVQFADQVDRDIFRFYVDKGYLSIQIFFMRQGKLLSRDFNLMPLYDEEADEVIRFVVDFYRANTYPKELLVPAGVDVELWKVCWNVRWSILKKGIRRIWSRWRSKMRRKC